MKILPKKAKKSLKNVVLGEKRHFFSVSEVARAVRDLSVSGGSRPEVAIDRLSGEWEMRKLKNF